MDLRGKSLLKETDLSADEFRYLLELAGRLKAERRTRSERQYLTGQTIALIFDKPSTRTRCAFETAAYHQGALVTYLGPESSQFGHKETVADSARVLGRMYDGIEYRGFAQSTVETLAAHAGVPVWNGLTDQWHPTQSLCDVFTMLESSGKPAEQIAYCYVGDARFNMGASLLTAGAMLGMDVRIAAPEQLWPSAEVRAGAERLAALSGGRVTVTDDVRAGVEGVDFIHTDVWVSMGEAEAVWRERIALLSPYRVTAELLAASGRPDVKFMHCLPSFHNLDTVVGAHLAETFGTDGLEVTDEVFESSASIVFDQAENRYHTIKAILVATLTGTND